MSPADKVSIAISIIGLILTLITVWAGIKKNQNDNVKEREKAAARAAGVEARLEEQMKELTREVREHNNFARRMPVLEEKIEVANHRIKDLEAFHKPS